MIFLLRKKKTFISEFSGKSRWKTKEMKKYLERDKVQLLSLTESTLAKLETLTDEEFGQLELYPDFDV